MVQISTEYLILATKLEIGNVDEAIAEHARCIRNLMKRKDELNGELTDLVAELMMERRKEQ